MTERAIGIVLGASGIALMCAMDAVAKALGVHLSAFQVVFVRYLGSAIWLALWIFVVGGSWPRSADIGRQSIRAVMLVATASMFFYAVAQLPLAVVAALAMTAPLYVTLIGATVFKEPMGRASWVALALGALGAAIILIGGDAVDFGNSDGKLLAWGAAIMAPVTYAATLALLKQHSGHENPAVMTLGQSAIAALLVSPLALGTLPEWTAPVVGLAALIGLLGAAGFLLLINGLRRLPVSVFAGIDYTGLMWAALLGFVFFGEVPGLQVVLGAVLIIAACLCVSRQPAPIVLDGTDAGRA